MSAKAVYVKKAQKNIYVNGKAINYVSVKGKRSGETLTRIDKTTPANSKDPILIKAGEPYYWWSLKIGYPRQYSKTPPKRSQLTLSNFLSQLWDMEDELASFSTPESIDDFNSFKEDLISNIQSLLDETQSSLDNMPEGLQQGPTGELLQERIDGLESWISDLENVEVEESEDEEEQANNLENAVSDLQDTSSGL